VSGPVPGRRPADVAFVAAVGLYLAGCLFVLGQGLVAVIASEVESLHEALHVRALDPGVTARVAQRIADASHRVPSWPQIVLDYSLSLLNLVLAAVLVWLRPKERTSRLLVVAFIGAAGVFNLTAQAALEQLPMTDLEVVAQTSAHLVAGLAYVYALLLFPDGRPVPRWRRSALLPLYGLGTAGALVLLLQVEGPQRPAALLLSFGLAVPLVGAAAQAYRIRWTPDATGQAQARLVFWALLPSVGFGLAFVALHGLSTGTIVFDGRHVPNVPTTLYRSFQPAIALVPMALFAGLLRYRLWDIERVLSRTIVYALATGVLGGLYLGFVVTAQQVLGTIAATPLIEGRFAVAVTTLLLASLFRPVRDRVQRFVDRRFHRQRYDAQLTVERFGRRLRDQVAVEHIVGELESVLDEVIEPAHSSVWVPSPAGPEQRTP
jgi:hypothetical protein